MTEEESFHRHAGMRTRIVRWYTRLRERGFFRYVGRNVLWIVALYSLLILLLFLLGKYLVDFDAFFGRIIESLSGNFVFLLFFVSESFTGMIPVDLFTFSCLEPYPMPEESCRTGSGAGYRADPG